jgi:NADH-quinone oxidoreductase subunit H
MESIFTFDNLYFALGVKVLAVVGFFLVAPLAVGYMEHKVLGHMQARLGPMEAGIGPIKHGVGQLVADGAKFIQKEDIIPAAADRWVFALAPGVALVPALAVLVVVPFGPGVWIENLDAGIFFALAASGVSVIGLLMAGWASANKYSLMGGLRAAAQLIAYELPLVLAVVGVVIQAETLSLQGIVEAQRNFEINVFGVASFPAPYIVPQFLGLLIFMTAMQAELTQPPFDMPVAESELVGGYMVEYSGFRFLFFFLGEFGTAFAFSAIAATMFLGGWAVPFVGAGTLANVLGPLALAAKTILVGFFIFWFRISYPRLREDQLQSFAWKFLIPLSLANILLTGIFKVVF